MGKENGDTPRQNKTIAFTQEVLDLFEDVRSRVPGFEQDQWEGAIRVFAALPWHHQAALSSKDPSIREPTLKMVARIDELPGQEDSLVRKAAQAAVQARSEKSGQTRKGRKKGA